VALCISSEWLSASAALLRPRPPPLPQRRASRPARSALLTRPQGGFSFGAAPAASTGARLAQPRSATADPRRAAPAFGAAATPSLFGAAPAAQQPASGGLFGAAPAAQLPASGGGLFGSQPAAASTPGSFSFGGASTGLFGAAAPAAVQQPAAPASFSFGAGPLALGGAAAQAPPAALPPPASAAASTLVPSAEIQAISDALTRSNGNPAYRFRTLLLNIVEAPEQRLRPAGVDELAWREALADAGGEGGGGDGLWPILARGFEDLCSRYREQSEALQRHSAALDALSAEAARRQRERQASIVARLERLRSRHEEQANDLLRAARVSEALDARAAPWAPEPLRPEEAALRARLTRLRADLGGASGGGGGAQGLGARAAALHAAARARDAGAHAARARAAAAARGEAGGPRVTTESVALVAQMLGEQAAALRALAEVVKRDARDVSILEAEARAPGGEAAAAFQRAL